MKTETPYIKKLQETMQPMKDLLSYYKERLKFIEDEKSSTIISCFFLILFCCNILSITFSIVEISLNTGIIIVIFGIFAM